MKTWLCWHKWEKTGEGVLGFTHDDAGNMIVIAQERLRCARCGKLSVREERSVVHTSAD